MTTDWYGDLISEIEAELSSSEPRAAALFALCCAQRASAALTLRERHVGAPDAYAEARRVLTVMWQTVGAEADGDAGPTDRAALERLASYDEPTSPLTAELAGRAVQAVWFAHAAVSTGDDRDARSAAESTLTLVDTAASAALGPSPSGRVDEAYERRIGETEVVRFEISEQLRSLSASRSHRDPSVVVREQRHALDASATLLALLDAAIGGPLQSRT